MSRDDKSANTNGHVRTISVIVTPSEPRSTPAEENKTHHNRTASLAVPGLEAVTQDDKHTSGKPRPIHIKRASWQKFMDMDTYEKSPRKKLTPGPFPFYDSKKYSEDQKREIIVHMISLGEVLGMEIITEDKNLTEADISTFKNAKEARENALKKETQENAAKYDAISKLLKDQKYIPAGSSDKEIAEGLNRFLAQDAKTLEKDPKYPKILKVFHTEITTKANFTEKAISTFREAKELENTLKNALKYDYIKFLEKKKYPPTGASDKEKAEHFNRFLDQDAKTLEKDAEYEKVVNGIGKEIIAQVKNLTEKDIAAFRKAKEQQVNALKHDHIKFLEDKEYMPKGTSDKEKAEYFNQFLDWYANIFVRDPQYREIINGIHGFFSQAEQTRIFESTTPGKQDEHRKLSVIEALLVDDDLASDSEALPPANASFRTSRHVPAPVDSKDANKKADNNQETDSQKKLHIPAHIAANLFGPPTSPTRNMNGHVRFFGNGDMDRATLEARRKEIEAELNKAPGCCEQNCQPTCEESCPTCWDCIAPHLGLS